MQERDDWHPADQTTDNSEYEPTYMEDDPGVEEEAQETQPERASETLQLNINQPFVQLSPQNVSRTMQQGDPNAFVTYFNKYISDIK